ncbi:MAG: hypothetical protein LBC89_02610 [Bacteroidales bacterium]|jgi:hypothetical protein|nr:hypothetical protein [Bacteroidales bacterium]
MALQICPKYKTLSFTWSIDKEELSLTKWMCYSCGYIAWEDEKKQRDCSYCGAKQGWVSELQDFESKYWRCANCRKIDPINP